MSKNAIYWLIIHSSCFQEETKSLENENKQTQNETFACCIISYEENNICGLASVLDERIIELDTRPF